MSLPTIPVTAGGRTPATTLFLRMVGRRRIIGLGVAIVLVVIAAAVAAPWLAPYDPLDIQAAERLHRPARNVADDSGLCPP